MLRAADLTRPQPPHFALKGLGGLPAPCLACDVDRWPSSALQVARAGARLDRPTVGRWRLGRNVVIGPPS